jgi:hypothetical protein
VSVLGPISSPDPIEGPREVPAVPPPTESRSRGPIRLVITASLLLVSILFALLMYGWIHFSRKFGNIDHNADKVTTDSGSLQNSVPKAQNMIEIEFVTTYSNSPAGVSLRLPGMWHSINAPGPIEQDPAHRYCLLESNDGFLAIFWPIFPDPRLSLESDSRRMITRFSSSSDFTFKQMRDLTINGRPGKELIFGVKGENDYRMTMIRNWPALYLLAVVGSTSSKDTWKRIDDALPTSLDIH